MAGGKAWEFSDGQWSEVPDPLDWDGLDADPMQTAGFRPAWSWGPADRPMIRLYAGPGPVYRAEVSFDGLGAEHVILPDQSDVMEFVGRYGAAAAGAVRAGRP